MTTKANNRTVRELDNSPDWKGEYYFIHAADTQFGLIDDIAGGKGDKWQEEIEITRRGISIINKLSPTPKFLFINGDLVNAFPEYIDLKRQQIIDLKHELSKINGTIPILVTSGNHDIGNQPTIKFIDDYKTDFGDDYYSYAISGVKYIALNSQPFFERSNIEDFHVEQMKWLNHELESAKSGNYKSVVIFMHIPLFLKTPDEPDQYFNITKPLRMQLLNDFADAGVKAVFCGHYHRNAGGVWTSTNNKKIEVVVSSALGCQLGKAKPGFTVVKVGEDSIQQKYFALDEVPSDLNSIDFDS